MITRQGKRLAILSATLLVGVAAARANSLSNPSFEIESAFSYGAAINWKMNDPDDHGDAWGSAARENWRARDGQFVATVRGTWAGAGDYGGWWQEVEGHAGHTYRFAAWLWADAAWTAQTQELKLEFWNWDRTQLLGSAVNAFWGIGEEWIEKQVVAVAPEGTEWVRVVINVTGAGETGSLNIDTVELTDQP